MINIQDIIRDNIELKGRLELAEKWMRREVATSIVRIQKEKSTKHTRRAIHNIFEAEGLDILTRRIITQFDNSLENAPKYTLERLIDAEIYWNTLQQYPQMDALPIVLAYQKIFDAWIEERLIAPWRQKIQDSRFKIQDSTLDKDLQNIIYKNYTLSIGRLYQILSLVRDGVDLSPMTETLITYWQKEIPNTLAVLLSDACFIPFRDLIELEIFSRKRHEAKVTYSDAKRARELVIDETSQKSFFEMIFSI